MPRLVLLTLLAPAGCSLLFDPPPGAGAMDAASDGAPIVDDGAPPEDGAPPDGGAFVSLCPSGDRVAHWRFEGDFTNTITDTQGRHDGEIVNRSPTAILAPHGQAALFHANDEGFVKVDDDDMLDLRGGSIEVLVRYDSSDAPQQVVARDAQGTGAGHFRIQRRMDEKIYVRLQKDGCASDADCTLELNSQDAVPNGKWAQIVVNFGCVDSADCRVELFVGDKLQATSTQTYNFEGAENPLVFATDQGDALEGSSTGDPEEYLDGAIDEIVLCETWVDPAE